jgi:tRNA U34 5-methylaminomethyl-2-thiouridine-forming methyltransferase MnmC
VGSWTIKFVPTQDGSNTLYSKEYNQHYHSCKDGALNESLLKHIIPALSYHQGKKQIAILDICFGLGYNTLATLYYIKKHNLDIKIDIYSPELDLDLIQSLEHFVYPKEFQEFTNIIAALSQNFYYEDEKLKIEIFQGDAREYIQKLKRKIDIVYQDPFSSEVNQMLWTVEYFEAIEKLLHSDGIITTYSIATPVRLSMAQNGLNIYEIRQSKNKKSTIALKEKINDPKYTYIDMELKKQRNPKAKALYDKGE